MKWHKEITSEAYPIYESDTLEGIDKEPKTLSMMKQENIRIALQKSKFKLRDIKMVSWHRCGLCDLNLSCSPCYIFKKIGGYCTDLSEHRAMKKARTRKAFAKAHKAWCKKIGLWGKNWN